jgi:transposase
MKEANTRYKTQLQKDLDRVFPEFNSLFSAPYGPTYMRILSEFQSAVIISDTDIRTLRKVLKNTGRGRSVSFTAEELKRLAKSSVGQPNTILEMEIRHLVTLIADIDSCIAEVDKKIEEFSLDLNSPILSIPGISHFSGTSIISEIGDVNRFSDVNKLISFAGVNPIVYQSGNTNLKMTRLSKKGSKYLRKTLYQIITPVIQNNTVFMNYYNKKISQGKSPRCAQGHCVRKLLRIIYHILKTGNSFDPDLIR